ncbi:MAG: glutaredoxin family protein [Methanolinea sp.]|nr:glutaredoxin family protein [Methanolinea sp.]
MTNTDNIIVYSLELCPNCEILKKFLKEKEISFIERDLSTAEAMAHLRINGVFVREAPVLQRGDKFLTTDALFSGSGLRTEAVLSFIGDD